MEFQKISVKSAVEKINATSNGWFLPAIQRPYVWGSRHESEKYICRLFDSILQGYPIGTLIVWNTDKKIPYREFISHYTEGSTAPFADENFWSRADKGLVYDGQQRLQTLYSCLKNTLDDRILVYNLLFQQPANDEDTDSDGIELNGFSFIDRNTTPPPGYVHMPSLFSQTSENKVMYRKSLIASVSTEMSLEEELVFETAFDKLWGIFVGGEQKSLAWFSCDSSWSEERVNDIFQRLNTGGVPLSGADLLLSKIKAKKYDYEEILQQLSSELHTISQGYELGSSALLQMLHFLVKKAIRLDADRVTDADVTAFIEILPQFSIAIKDFVTHFLWGVFKINSNSIVPRHAALIPLVSYIYQRYTKGIKYQNIESENIIAMKQYFILSQVNDWNTQTMVNRGSNLALESDMFPLKQIADFAVSKGRNGHLSVSTIAGYQWFMLKVILPTTSYVRSRNSSRSYRPELDHIFPVRLANRPENYDVDIIWNLQPVPGEINVSKSNKHPKSYFGENPAVLTNHYDYVPALSDALWDDPDSFVAWRREKMLSFIKSQYRLDVQ